MKLLWIAVLAAMACSAPVRAADDRSPYDKNPACMDRNVDSTQADCVIKDDGKPRHKYPPRTTSGGAVTPATPAAPAVSREAAPTNGRKGG